MIREQDCAADGQACGYIDDQIGYFCLPPGSPAPQPEPEPAPEPEPTPEPPVDGCGGVDYAGECRGDTAVWCEAGGLRQVDCAARGERCDWAGDALGWYCVAAPAPAPEPEPMPPADGCGGVDFLGECRGDVAVWCTNGALQQIDCAAQGQGCGWVDDATGYYCQSF